MLQTSNQSKELFYAIKRLRELIRKGLEPNNAITALNTVLHKMSNMGIEPETEIYSAYYGEIPYPYPSDFFKVD
jgi:hypothetical protein